jgi:hypothetical protein
VKKEPFSSIDFAKISRSLKPKNLSKGELPKIILKEEAHPPKRGEKCSGTPSTAPFA